METRLFSVEFIDVDISITARIKCMGHPIKDIPCGTKYEETAREVVADYMKKVLKVV